MIETTQKTDTCFISCKTIICHQYKLLNWHINTETKTGEFITADLHRETAFRKYINAYHMCNPKNQFLTLPPQPPKTHLQGSPTQISKQTQT